ncbi:YegP family protein [Dyella sp. BiH032]|uniref:YegP family protein n=1 Tax=Dyella sp. BiH032 TaxID=3075430 RepID=UPI002892E9F2|nr:YegP family protein [Dyella sp. BiH032]WNL47920.1 YegP family protein [Dyella sp. BiH032]
MAGRYLLRRSGAQYYFVLQAANYQTLITSERYTTKQSAEGGIASVRVNSPIDARYNRLTAKDGSPYFVLKAANGEPIGTSETYSSAGAREGGIEATKIVGPIAPTVDET